MSVIRQEEYERLITIFQCRSEAGLQALRTQLYARRDQINSYWFNVTGDDLIMMQGEARAVAGMIKMIDVAPKQFEGNR